MGLLIPSHLARASAELINHVDSSIRNYPRPTSGWRYILQWISKSARRLGAGGASSKSRPGL